MLRALADAEGLTASDYVRQMLRRAFIEKWNPDALAAARRPRETAEKPKPSR